MILAISYSSQRTFAIYNYGKIEWISPTKNIFIGYTDGKGFTYTNPFSNNGDSDNDPSLISFEIGNTGNEYD